MSATTALTRSELRLFLREPAALFWIVAFPVLLLIVLGSIPSLREADPGTGVRIINYYTPVIILMSLAFLAVSTMPAVIAGYREQRILKRLATTPIGSARMLGAQLLMYLGLAIAMALLVLAVARLAFDVPLPRQPLGFAIALLLAIAALLAIGVLVAALVPTGRTAGAVGAMLFFPLMFFAGLWIPIPVMPDVLADIARYSPLGAATEAMTATAAGEWPTWWTLPVLAAYAVTCGGLAVRFFRWEP
ncbi:ABC transporter permease [Epidermidibacterium keratini]|uniref:Transport permease protein n=1 Tax=Epidermidibacterium keratini TaxID=1891644 RepID=A0A7L4YLT1_9ACTN|nr:ABC transporter permease [Epidermidibacterium keratini]QHB99832.1 ABC transporter permease [Epidermidibacterium keratini]